MRLGKGIVTALAVAAMLGGGAPARADVKVGENEKKEAPAPAARPFLGVGLAREVAEGAEGVALDAVMKGYPAAEAGLKKGDILVKLDDKELTGPKALLEMLAKKKPGDEVALLVDRDGWRKTIKLKLAKRPADDDDDGDDDGDGDDDDGPGAKNAPHHDEHHEQGKHDEKHEEHREGATR